jgi:hypothetical protein
MRGLRSLLLLWLSSTLSLDISPTKLRFSWAPVAMARSFVQFRPTLKGVAQVPPAVKPADEVWSLPLVRETLIPPGKKPDELQREILSTLPLKLKRRLVPLKTKTRN